MKIQRKKKLVSQMEKTEDIQTLFILSVLGALAFLLDVLSQTFIFSEYVNFEIGIYSLIVYLVAVALGILYTVIRIRREQE